MREAFVVPRDYKEFYSRYSVFVARKVRQIDTVGRHYEDALQAVWLRLVEADFLGKFNASLGRAPQTMTGWEAAAHIGITWDQWKVSQWRTRIGKTDWAPTPVSGKGCRKDAVYNTAEVEAVAHHFKRHGHISTPVKAADATRGRFEAYLTRAVINAFNNFCRTLMRKDKDTYLPPAEDGSAWESKYADRGALPDVKVSLHEEVSACDDPESVLELVDGGYTLTEAVTRLSKPPRVRVKVVRKA
jgi:DNA-directed RNA polymerase specialized sigma24 family protein